MFTNHAGQVYSSQTTKSQTADSLYCIDDQKVLISILEEIEKLDSATSNAQTPFILQTLIWEAIQTVSSFHLHPEKKYTELARKKLAGSLETAQIELSKYVDELDTSGIDTSGIDRNGQSIIGLSLAQKLIQVDVLVNITARIYVDIDIFRRSIWA